MKPIDYESLLDYLREWGNREGVCDYDSVGMFHLIGACLDSLSDPTEVYDFETARECFTPRQISCLEKLLQHARPSA